MHACTLHKMEVIKPMDFSSFAAFAEHLNKSTQNLNGSTSTAAAVAIEDEDDDVGGGTANASDIANTGNIANTTTTIITNAASIKANAADFAHNDNYLYCKKMERQGKMEIAAKERETQRLQSIPKKWNRREEYEFLRVLTGYGIDLQPPTAMAMSLAPDWTKFKQMAHLERKGDETLSDYYKVFIAMCKRQAGVKLNDNERGLEGIIEDISEEHAKLILDRLELLSKLRDISRHPQLEERLKHCLMNADTPDWWEPGRHDKELITAVLKYGLYRSETFIFSDPNFSFAESEKRFIRELEAQIQRTIKLEAFNAEKTPQTVKEEIIDLDDELLTKDSLIKKEQFINAKPEIKNELAKEFPRKELRAVDNVAESAEAKKTASESIEIKSDSETAEHTAEKTQENAAEAANTEDEETTKPTEKSDVENDKTEELVDGVENLEKKTIASSEEQTAESEKPAAEAETKMETDETHTEAVDKTVDEHAEKKSTATDIEMLDESAAEKTEKIAEDKTKEVEAKSEQIEKPDGPTADEGETSEKASTSTTEIETEISDVEKKSDVAETTQADKFKEISEKDTTESSTVNEAEKEPMKSAETASKNKDDTVAELAIEKKSTTAAAADEEILDLATATTGSTDPDDDEVMKEKERAVEEECNKQAAELKARFPDLEVIQPATVKQKLEKPKLEMCMIRWFKDFALERRIAHIVTCVETNKWPVDKSYSAYAGCKGIDLNIALHEAIPHLNAIERRSTTPDVITITTEQGVTKHLQSSQMQQVAGAASHANANAVAAAAAAAVAAPQTPSVAVSAAAGKNTVAGSIVGLDANSINAAVAAAVAAAAGNNPTSLSSLLPGMTLTPATTLNNSTPPSTTTTPTSVGKKRKRHIAIDVETERAKLHALLNSSQGMAPKDWETEIANMEALTVPATGPSGRRSASSTAPSPVSASSTLGSLQPPPAHQHASLSRQSSGQFNKPAVPPLKTPPPSMGAPMDLSSSLPKVNMADMLKSAANVGAIDLSEVQDFSMSSKKCASASTSSLHAALSSAFPSMGAGKSKLDDTLNKLMKKNNCSIEEPIVGKEKKRKKLDEIVLGLSAAKEQKTFPDPSLPSSKKPQIPPSVSVTPANVPSPLTNQNQQNQKPFTITVTTVPGKSKGGGGGSSISSQAAAAAASNSGLSALQNMTSTNMSAKDSLNALLAQTMSTDPQTFIKQQQKMMQCLPPAQRKAYENMLAEMEQAMKISLKCNSHDVKVNKWLSDMGAPLNDALNMDYATTSSNSGNSSRRSNRQQSSNNSQQASAAAQMSKASAQPAPSHSQHQQQSMAGPPPGLTGDEPVPVINKQTGKRLTGSKAPQLKRLMQWLTENPTYEVDPKWLEQMQNPMSVPSPKPTSLESSYTSASKSHGGRPSSTSSNASSGSHSQQQQASQQLSTQSAGSSSSSKKSSRQSAIDQANAAMPFGSLAGLNPNLLASLPGLGAFDPKNPLSAFDPKNPLLSMPFAGMPSMGNIPGLGNLNNMNLFASLASMGGLGNLAGMDANSLAALMAAAGPALSGLTGTTSSGNTGKSASQSSGSSSKKNKNDLAQQNAANAALASSLGAGNSNTGGSNSSNKNSAAASASQLAAGFPFLFPNPSLLYPPMGLGGLNPYSLGSTGLGSAYDQLAQQYNLLNGGGATSSASQSSTTQSKLHQSQSKSSSSRSSASSSSAASAAAAAAASAANLMNAISSMTGVGGAGGTSTQSSSSQSNRGGGRQSAANRAHAAAAAQAASAEIAQLSSLLMPGADPHLLESLSRMSGMDLAQATRLMSSLGMPPVSGASTSSSVSDKRSSSNSSSTSAAAAAAAAHAAQEKQAAKEQQKWMDSLARGVLPSDLATLQAFSQGKLPASMTGGSGSSGGQAGTSSSSASSSKSAAKAAAAAAAAAAAQLPQIPGMPGDFSQAFLAEMAAQAMAAAGGSLPLTGPGSLASLTGSLAGLTAPPTSSSTSSSSSSSKRQREQDAFKQQMDFYTKTLGLGSGISLIPTSVASSSNTSSMSMADDHHKSKRSRMDTHTAQMSAKDELTAAALAAGLPFNLGGGMTSIEKSLRSGNASTSNSANVGSLPEADKVTLTPLNSAGIAANLPSQTTITIAPPISSGASSSSERSERSESRISLTITNAADAAKLPPPYEEADELIIQPILKKPQQTASASAAGSSHSGSIEDLEAAAANMAGGSSSSSAVAAAVAAEENRRSSSRLKRPRSGVVDHNVEQPPEKRRELRSTRHTRQSGGNVEATLNLSTGSEAEEKNE